MSNKIIYLGIFVCLMVFFGSAVYTLNAWTTYECTKYGEITGHPTQKPFMSDCYIYYGQWRSYTEHLSAMAGSARD